MQGRDLSPVTDKLWKRFYEKQFGVKNTNLAIERMRVRKVSIRWMKLYEVSLLWLIYHLLVFLLKYLLLLLVFFLEHGSPFVFKMVFFCPGFIRSYNFLKSCT